MLAIEGVFVKHANMHRQARVSPYAVERDNATTHTPHSNPSFLTPTSQPAQSSSSSSSSSANTTRTPQSLVLTSPSPIHSSTGKALSFQETVDEEEETGETEEGSGQWTDHEQSMDSDAERFHMAMDSARAQEAEEEEEIEEVEEEEEEDEEDLPELQSPEDSGSDDDEGEISHTHAPHAGKTAGKSTHKTMVYASECVEDTQHIYQDSGATQYICRDQSMMTNMTNVKRVKFKTGNGERKISKGGLMQMCRVDGRGQKHCVSKHAYYDPLMPINIAPTGTIDHFHKRSIIHQNGQMFILKNPVNFIESDVLVRGRLTQSLLYRWDTEQDKPLPIHTRYVPKGAPKRETSLG